MNICLPFREDYSVTQGFGGNSQAYAKFGLKGHNGIDYGLPTGTTVVACDDGTIVRIADDPTGYGHYVKIQHTWGESIYAHLQTNLVAPNLPVKKGQAIGLSNNTGNSTGPHLHFGIRIYPYNSNDGYSGYSDPRPYITGHFVPEPPQGGVGDMNEDEVIKLFISVLKGRTLESITPDDIKIAHGYRPGIEPFPIREWANTVLSDEVINPTVDIYLKQITKLTNRVKELENAENQPIPEPTPNNPVPETPNTGPQGSTDVPQQNSGEDTSHNGSGGNIFPGWSTLFPTISAILNWIKKNLDL